MRGIKFDKQLLKLVKMGVKTATTRADRVALPGSVVEACVAGSSAYKEGDNGYLVIDRVEKRRLDSIAGMYWKEEGFLSPEAMLRFCKRLKYEPRHWMYVHLFRWFQSKEEAAAYGREWVSESYRQDESRRTR